MPLSSCTVRAGTGILGALAVVAVASAASTTTYSYDAAGNLTGVTGCTPTTCAAQGNPAGPIPDGCGGTIWCTCAPTTCAAQGKTCGSISNGCGGTLSCGTCPTGQVCSTSNVCVASPALSLSTTSLAFNGTAGGSNPAAQTITATNSGGGTLAMPTTSIGYGSGGGWLSARVNGSAAPYTITVTPSLSGLTAGTYTATISVSSAGASNSPRTVNVTLAIGGGGTMMTFGRTTEGSYWTGFPPNPGSISVSRFTLTEGASVIKLSVICNAAASGHFKGVIYRAGAVNTPTTLVASTNEITSLAVGTNDLLFTTPVSLTPGDYYLGIWGDQSASVNAQASTGDNVWYGLPYTGTLPATWNTAAQNVSANEKPIYATYIPTGGGGTTKAFGKTTTGLVTERLFPVEAGGITVSKFTLTESGQVTKLTVQWVWGNAVAHTRGVIYASSGANSAGALVAQTNEAVGMDNSTNGGWQDHWFAAPVSLTPGDYYLGVVSDTLGASTGDVAGDNLYASGSYTAGQNAPAAFPSSPGVSTYQRAIYATYTTP